MSVSFHPDRSDRQPLAAAGAPPTASSSGAKLRSRLFTKYVALFVAVVSVALLSNGIFEVFFYYREHKAALIRIQHEQAEAAAAKIGQFVKEIESQLGWTAQLPWSAGSIEQRRFDALRLLRQVPAITELAQVDSTGRERLRVSRLAMDVVDSGLDLSRESKFTEAVARKVYYGPVYFRRESEPYMTLSLAGTRRDAGVSIAEVNLKLIWDVVSQIKVGERGRAYVVANDGRLIAHPDISLVLRNTDMSKLEQVQAARAGRTDAAPEALQGAPNIQGQQVLTASAPIAPLGWTMFVELPVEEAYASLYESLKRLAIVLVGALVFAMLAGIFLARRMVGPIQALRAGASRIGGGDLTQRISIRTGDELEGLADQFNEMGARLQESYADLEKKVEVRTAELSESLQQQTATAEILRIISGSLSDTQPVFEAIVQAGLRLFPGAAISIEIPKDGQVNAVAIAAEDAAGVENWRKVFPFPLTREYMAGIAILDRRVVDVADAREGSDEISVGRRNFLKSGYLAVTKVPMLRGDLAIGVLSVSRPQPGALSDKQLAILKALADQAVIAIENTRLLGELRESLQQQTATADVLKVISRSAFDLQPVLDTLTESVARLCEADISSMHRSIDGEFHGVASYGYGTGEHEHLRTISHKPGRGSLGARVLDERRAVHIPDFEADDEYTFRDFPRQLGVRSMLGVPLMREDEPIGILLLFRKSVRPFTTRQIELVETFADQAVIAIENARLFNEVQTRTAELSESLQQQTATADVLKVISRSAFDLNTVLQTLIESAAKLCNAASGNIWLRDGDVLHAHAGTGMSPQFIEFLAAHSIGRDRGKFVGRAFLTGELVHLPDVLADPEYEFVESAKVGEFRAALAVPMVREGEIAGVFALVRPEPGPFTAREIELVRTFVDQALIAIENARLFAEVQARTAEVTEALEYQTATGDVLGVISRSPNNLQPVLDSIVQIAVRICHAQIGDIVLVDGEQMRVAANVGEMARPPGMIPMDRTTVMGRSIIDGAPVHVHDLLNAGDEFPAGRQLAVTYGHRTTLAVPLLHDGRAIGAILLRRAAVDPFAEKQIKLLATFADQAVIAINNVGLFEEVQARTAEVTEALQQQTATADVLKVISSSAFDLQAVLDTLVESAAKLCEAEQACVFQRKGDLYHWVSNFGFSPELVAYANTHPFAAGPHSTTSRVALEGRAIHNPDVLADPEYTASEYQRLGNYRTMLGVPLLREGSPVGVFILTREKVRPFTDRQIELVTTFADQAVIAINNVGLFEEVQARTAEVTEALEYQTATGEVLGVISRSPNDLQPVLDTIVATAHQLCDAQFTLIFMRRADNLFHLAASQNAEGAFLEWLISHPITEGDGTASGRAAKEKGVVHFHDAASDPRFTDHARLAQSKARTQLAVPLMQADEVIGVVFLARTVIEPFTDRQVKLVSTFADQAVIAINNVGLFEEVQARTKELSLSLEDLRTAQDRLVQTEKLASLGQLTAGIAHEIKNPLNFVNNFSALSAELIGELNDVLKPAALDHKMREEIDELTHMLQGNLEKVVQHGKRADSIVKNMLLHSREGSGEHRPADINAIVEESLNLAYHGARAEKSGFNITLQRDLDPAAGMIDLYPQEITRVFLNLISNGFYAATKRKAETGDGFEPTLSAATKNRGDKVEIRIRDNGVGIPQQVKEKMFNPFFTTKPAGEGTGLGLSMSHDIVVKQHGGTIDVETEPDTFTEFIITLPRMAAIKTKNGG